MSNNFIQQLNWAFSHLFEAEVYAYPRAFYLLYLIPLFLTYLYWKSKKDVPIVQLSVDGLQWEKTWKDYLFWVPQLLFVVAFVFFVYALARPQDAYSWEEEQAKGIDIVLAMDLSTSMLARDFRPNRLEASKDIAIDFVKGRNNDRFGLVVFAGESFTQCPLTIDHQRLVELFEGIKTGVLEDGTAIGSGLAMAIKRLKESTAESKVIILLTDGENNSGDIAPEVAGTLAKQFGIRVYTIGVGKNGKAEAPVAIDFSGNLIFDQVDVKIDESLLKAIAKETGGRYFRATDNAHLKDIYEEIDQLERTELASLKHSSKTEMFLPFLSLGFLFYLCAKIMQVLVLKNLYLS